MDQVDCSFMWNFSNFTVFYYFDSFYYSILFFVVYLNIIYLFHSNYQSLNFFGSVSLWAWVNLKKQIPP